VLESDQVEVGFIPTDGDDENTRILKEQSENIINLYNKISEE